MDDLISRQAAIDALNEYFARIGKLKRRGLTKGEKAISLDTVGAIKALPSAQPKRKKGFWEWGEDEDYRCSVCQKYVYGCLGEVLSGHYKYCPYCGAAMEGEEDDEED